MAYQKKDLLRQLQVRPLQESLQPRLELMSLIHGEVTVVLPVGERDALVEYLPNLPTNLPIGVTR